MKTRQKLGQYLIYRKGANRVNQSQSGWVPIAIVEAESTGNAVRTTSRGYRPCPKLAAKIVATAGNIDVWPHQQLRALPAKKASLAHWYGVRSAALELKRRGKLEKQSRSYNTT
jgi:hypothetical protein